MQFEDTDIKIFNAFIEVAETVNEFSDISIPKIAVKLGVTKQAIYKSTYHNVNEIIQAMHVYVDEEPRRKIQQFITTSHRHEPLNFIYFFAQEILPEFYKKRRYLKIIYSDKADPTWNYFVLKNYLSIIESYVKHQSSTLGFSSTDLARIVITQITTMIAIWMRQETPDTPEVFAPKFISLLSFSISDLLKEAK